MLKFADLSVEEQRRALKHIRATPFFTFKSARKKYEVFLATAHIQRTMHGALEFSIEALKWDVVLNFDRIGELVNRVYPYLAWTLREPLPGILPPYLIFAEVQSFTPIHATGNYYGSALVLVWFSEDVPGDLPAELAKLMQGLDWEQCAKDHCFD